MELGIFVTIALAIVGALIKLFANQAKLDTKVSVLWDAYIEEARQNTRRRGTMERSSEYHLSKQGLDMIPRELKDEIKKLVGQREGVIGFFTRKKANPKKMATWDIIEKLGGVSRLSYEAEKLGIGLSEMIVMVETYIRRHLE